jgi:serine/threonine protein kinase
MALERGSTLGPYQIVMRLGMGGMGEVYRARDPRLGRDVAIKVLTDEAALSWYEKAYALSPAYYPITNAMVDCHLKLGQEGQAAASLRRYLKLPSLDTHGRERAQWRLGDLSKKAA